eukprot:361026-Chlamydomonas_euryale.AAC.2
MHAARQEDGLRTAQSSLPLPLTSSPPPLPQRKAHPHRTHTRPLPAFRFPHNSPAHTIAPLPLCGRRTVPHSQGNELKVTKTIASYDSDSAVCVEWLQKDQGCTGKVGWSVDGLVGG